LKKKKFLKNALYLLKKKLRIDFSMKYILKYTDKFFISVSMNEKCFVEIPEKHRDFFFKNLKSSFDFLIENTNFLKLKNQSYLETYLKFMVDYSPAFLKKLDLELKTLNKNQLELFLEYIQYNFYFSKKANPLFDILRIKKGVLTKKVLSNEILSVCQETYTGFIRALKAKTAKIITVNIDGGKKTFLVKSFSGQLENNRFLIRLGTNVLALDINNFKIYAFKNSNFAKSKKTKITLKRKGNWEYLMNHFTDYENAIRLNRSTKQNNVRETTNEIILQVKEIKKLLKDYLPEKTAKRNESFKRAVKDLVKDKKSRKIIKTRFRK
jgi:hypothetical protein